MSPPFVGLHHVDPNSPPNARALSFFIKEVTPMPHSPRPGCKYPGCNQRAMPDSAYCAKHRKLMNHHYEQYGRHYISHERYGNDWRKIRDHYIRSHPYCESCFKQGKLTKATLVHHVIPISQGGTHGLDNLMSLCASCHRKIHNNMLESHDYNDPS